MKNKEIILNKLLEITNLLQDDMKEELAKKVISNKHRSNLLDVAVVYKLNVETERMLAVGQASFRVGEEDYILNLFPNPEKQFKSLPSIRDAKAYYPDWFIENGKGGFKEIYPSNRISEVYIPNEFDDFPIGVISDHLSVTLFSSYESLPQNKYNKIT